MTGARRILDNAAYKAGARYVDHIRATERDWPHLTTLWEDPQWLTSSP